MQHYFEKLFQQLMDHGVRSGVSGLQLSNAALRQRVGDYLSQTMGEDGSLLADPVFEATFPWEAADCTMADLDKNLLSAALLKALDNPPKELREDYRFPKERKPYQHQLRSWQTLTDDKGSSLVVTSGTGSGKTECFLIPVLDDLVREFQQDKQPLEGIRALFLYPLNTLINSQKDRLSAWTDAFGEGVRYCLYNGLTPERPERDLKKQANIVASRQELRHSAPPMVVTNATMLEYMLVRTRDRPIIEQSQGTLRWIVLDEAHTYLGSQAAELALLLRRVMLAFNVSSQQVRFVATSATMGDEASTERLRLFLAQVAGIPIEQVVVLGGRRKVPPLPQQKPANLLNDWQQIADIDSEQLISNERFLNIAAQSKLRELRNRLTDESQAKPVMQLTQIAKQLFPNQPLNQALLNQTISAIDLVSGVAYQTPKGEIEPFLPLRSHIFGRTIGGLWACCNAQCSCKSPQLEQGDWLFGEVYFTRREQCQCGAPVFDMVSCSECNTIHLLAEEDEKGYIVSFRDHDDIDDFARELDPPEGEEPDNPVKLSGDNRVLLASSPSNSGEEPLTITETLHSDGRRGVQSEQGFQVHLHFPYEGLRCPNCETKERRNGSLMIRKILGVPFQLAITLPTLLEFSPKLNDGFAHPWEGRRLITFTDSRQGTARSAANLQLDAERTYLRSQVYHTLLGEQSSGNGEQAQALQQEIEQLTDSLQQIPAAVRPIIEKQIADKRQQKENLQKPTVLSWSTMAQKLASNASEIKEISSAYRQLDPANFSGDEATKTTAELLLAREFLRRPKRQNSLESMGLVKVVYFGLEKIVKVPDIAKQIGFELADWRDFLKLLMDWYVRASQAVESESYWQRWIGTRFPFRKLIAPLQERLKGEMEWPSVKKSFNDFNRFVRLLREGYQLNPDDKVGKNQIDAIFREAWETLHQAEVIKKVDERHYLLNLREQVGFQLMEQGWLCPITQRILDTSLKGLTPFLPPHNRYGTNQCQPVDIPLYPRAFDPTAQVRVWLKENPGVQNLRTMGLWSGRHDRVVETSHYFRTAEHSAQQPSQRLREFEKLFRQGDINILSCSTTMEMGVDIGGISVVAMNNVPPNPANYLQRAGRAGRRAETRSVSFTLCKDDPHGHHVMNNTRWPFDTAIPLPLISLQSTPIVQRHVNSLLLGRYLQQWVDQNSSSNILTLNCGWFFLAPEESESESPCEQMVRWCHDLQQQQQLVPAMSQLVAQSVLAGHRAGLLMENSVSALQKVAQRWQRDYNGYQQQLTMLQQADKAEENRRAIRAVEIGIYRMEKEYLLGELATQGFLPGYGFPNGVVSFNTLTAETLAKNENQRNSGNSSLKYREDNRQFSRDFPSRSRSTAIREYAPGADVVIDGQVYRSAGLNLSWQKPMTEQQIKEPQGFMFTWHCGQCGAAGMERHFDQTSHCHDCGQEIKPSNKLEVMEPNGFAVSINYQSHNDITRPTYLPVNPPRVIARGEWIPLIQGTLGRFRSTEQGDIIYRNGGVFDNGYAICLECGAAEDMSPLNKLPALFEKPHQRLRGGKVEGSGECSGSNDSWKIKPNIHLIHHDQTDIFELQLKHPQTGVYLNDPAIATTLAVALRHAAALALGISDDELGYAVKEVELDQERTWSILIYDTADGGAGYATAIDRQIKEILQKMVSALECHAHCNSACHHCLLTFDTQHQFELLNRNLAKEWLGAHYTERLQLPLSMQVLGEQSAMETSPLFTALDQAIQKCNGKQIRFYLGGEVNQWDLSISALKHQLIRWRAQQIDLQLIIYEQCLKALTDELRQQILLLTQGLDMGLFSVADQNLQEHAVWVAEVIGKNCRQWACRDQSVIEFGCGWGQVTEEPLIVAHETTQPVAVAPVDMSLILTPSITVDGDQEIEIAEELHGSSELFGERFWKLATEQSKRLNALLDSERLIRIKYSDRYLKNPLTVALLIQVIKALDMGYSHSFSGETRISVKSTEISGKDPSYLRSVRDDWIDDRARERAVEAAFDYVGLTASMGSYAKERMPHFRLLELQFESSVARIRLDEGFGYWETRGGWGSDFDFNASSTKQGERIAEWRGKLERRKKHYNTALVISVREN